MDCGNTSELVTLLMDAAAVVTLSPGGNGVLGVNDDVLLREQRNRVKAQGMRLKNPRFSSVAVSRFV